MVKYQYYPFEDIEITAAFLLYSSHIAFLDITILNVGQQKTPIQVIPFLRNNYRTFNQI